MSRPKTLREPNNGLQFVLRMLEITPYKLAKEIGVSNSTMYRYREGSRQPAKWIAKLIVKYAHKKGYTITSQDLGCVNYKKPVR